MSKPPLMNSGKKNRAPAPGDEIQTTEEAARRQKRSEKTMDLWRHAAQGPHIYRQQRGVRYLLSEIMAWGVSCRVAPQNTGD